MITANKNNLPAGQSGSLKNQIEKKMREELCTILQQQLHQLNIPSLWDLQQMVGESNREILFEELQK